MSIRRLRLCSGLVVAAFVCMHLLNHTLGLLSLEAMETGRRWVLAIWGNPLGMAALYGSLLLHLLLTLWSLYQRGSLRMKPWEAWQIVLGLLIPILLVGHIIGTRAVMQILDVEATYPRVVATLWLDGKLALRQSLLLLLVWLHLVVGLHFWLRLKPWYRQALPVLYPLVVLIPILALFGFVRAGLAIEELAAAPGWLDQLRAPINGASPEDLAYLAWLQSVILNVFGGLLLAAFAARQIRRFQQRRQGVFSLIFPSGREVEGTVGATMLEAIRAAGVPHASACGGRGRCTTCRVRVSDRYGELAPPAATESQALARIGAPHNVRLACQARPQGKVAIMPLLTPVAGAEEAGRRGGVHGREMQAVFMFVDLRGSTTLGERLLPYDVVFVLNQFFREIAQALETTEGHYAQFNGDGLMAIYGLKSGLESGCRQAIAGAVEMFRRLDALNRSLKPELGEPLSMGIGLHSGEAIVGTMGPPTSPNYTAIGDNVNIAARLESQTKAFACSIVVSVATARTAGVDLSAYPRHEIELRGRIDTVPVYALEDAAGLAAALSRL